MLSIEQLKQKFVEESNQKDEDTNDKPRTPFTIEDLIPVMRSFAYEIKDSDRNGANAFFNMIVNKNPSINQFNINFEVPNIILQELMTSEYVGEFQNYLRHELKNWGIIVHIDIREDPEQQTKFLTGKDRFELMARKNNNLITLKKIFNLDVEY